MPLGATFLKIVTTAGTLAAGGAASVMVIANDPKPATAPLQPHIVGAKQSTSTPTPTPLPPLPPSCGSVGAGGGAPVTLTSQQQTELQQLRQTPLAQRRALLLTFASADRMQIEAYQRQHAKPRGGDGGCKEDTSTAPAIAPDTVNGGDTTAPINTYVS
jgi:hypothetical protein